MIPERVKVNVADVDAANSLSALQSAYQRWREILGGTSQTSTADPVQRFSRVLDASIRFTGKSLSNDDDAHKSHACLSKGKQLIATALEWDESSVGKAGSEYSRIRGAQWRLVIAWSGLEQIIKRLANSTGRADVDRLLSHIGLPSYLDLKAPDGNLSKLRKWREQDRGDDNLGINGFLQASSKETKDTLRSWLISGRPLVSWTDAMMMAKVLRHVSAHGDLSATKIREWGLQAVFDRLVTEVGVVASMIFERMVAECRTILGDDIDAPVTRHNKALSLTQPHAEAVLRGRKAVECRSQPTKILGRVFIYASQSRLVSDEEVRLLAEYGFSELASVKLFRGMILGTVELHACSYEDGVYHWRFRNPEPWVRPKLPDLKPQGAWFTPFKSKP